VTEETGEMREEDDQLDNATPAEVWAAYLEAVACWEQCVWAYVTLCLYVPALRGCVGSEFEWIYS
jgi:hypothetical protein